MSTVKRTGGLGGLWPKPGRGEGAGPGKTHQASGRALPDSAHFTASSERLANLAGGPAPTFGMPSAAELVGQSPDLQTLIHRALKRATGHDVNLGPHAADLERHVRAGLASSHLSFDEIKRRLG